MSPRSIARERGKPVYLTGLPCPQGHNGPRNTVSGQCVECHKLSDARRRAAKRSQLRGMDE